MKKYFIILLVSVLLLPTFAYGANHYVRQGATGLGTGSDWANAWTSLPSTLTRGDIYYIADGSYPGYTFDDAESGSAYIYVKKATVSDHGTASGWQDSYGDGQAVFSGSSGSGVWNFTRGYYDVDGQVGGGPGSWDSGHGFKVIHSGATKGVRADRYSSGQSVKYVKISHAEIYGSGPDDSGPGNDNVYLIGDSSSNRLSNWEFRYDYLWYAGDCQFLTRYVDNVLIEYSLMYYNEMHTYEHSEGISHALGDNWIVRYNLWKDIQGTGVIVTAIADSWQIYGNVFYLTSSFPRPGQGPDGWDNGVIVNWSCCGSPSGATTNMKIYNNTIADLSSAPSNMAINFPYNAAPNSIEVLNNVFYNDSVYYNVGSGTLTHDYNAYFNTNTITETNKQQSSGDPFINSANYDFRLSLTTLSGMALPFPFTTDLLGVQRGVDGTWDRGAFEYGDGSYADLMPPASPGNLTINY